MADDYIEETLSRAERLKKLWQEDRDKAGVEPFKRRQILEREYAREVPDRPLRTPLEPGK